MRKWIMLAMVIGLLMTSIAYAECEYCGSRLVCTGMTKYEVLQICGPPDFAETYYLNGHGDKFLYNRGSSSFIYIFEFEGGILAHIVKGGYGFSK